MKKLDTVMVTHIAHNIPLFVETFYNHFMQQEPEFFDVFSNTEIDKQKKEFQWGLRHIVSIWDSHTELQEYLESLGIRHVTYRVKQEHYDKVKASFLHAVRATYNTTPDPQVEEHWSDVCDIIIANMLAGARRVKMS